MSDLDAFRAAFASLNKGYQFNEIDVSPPLEKTLRFDDNRGNCVDFYFNGGKLIDLAIVLGEPS